MNYSSILIEIMVSILAVLMLIIGLLLPRQKKKYVGYMSAFMLFCILIFSLLYNKGQNLSFYKGLYLNDNMAVYFKQIFLISAILVILMSISYVKRFNDSRSEFFSIIIFAALGMMVLASSNDLITLYIGLELMSISFIILTAYDKKNIKSAEAGTKYVLLSAMSTAVLLYGMSLFYGLSGSLEFSGLLSYLKVNYNQPMAIAASVFVLAGFSFKISVVPFHMWSPDIYEGAPTPITAFLAGGSKVAGFAVMIRLLTQVMNADHKILSILIMTLAILSIVIGNIIAIPQSNIKRMLAYSSIAHAGYILLALVSYSKLGVSAMLYYILLYIFANIGAFASITAFFNQTGKDNIKDLGGMWKRSPFLAATLMLSLLSMAGIPPAAGFIGKFYIFSEVIKQGYLWLAFIAMAMSVVSIYYYIVVIRVMLIGEASEDTPIQISLTLKTVMVISIIMTLIMGLYPGPITNWTTIVASAF